MLGNIEKAWVLTITGRKKYWGNFEYHNDPRTHYSYDNFVQNHKSLSYGDITFIREGEFITGISLIDNISIEPGKKILRSCPVCKIGKLRRRKTLKPEWRCDNGHLFNNPMEKERNVSKYIATFDKNYVRLKEPISWVNLNNFFENTSSHSIKAVFIKKILASDLKVIAPLKNQVIELIAKSSLNSVPFIGDTVDEAIIALRNLSQFLDGVRSFEDQSISNSNKLELPLSESTLSDLHLSIKDLYENLEKGNLHREEVESTSFLLNSAKAFILEYLKSAGKTAGALTVTAIATGIAQFYGLLDAALNALKLLF